MKICAIDIGWENFAIAIEHIKNSAIKTFAEKYASLAKTDKIIERKQHSISVKKMLEELYKNSRNIHLDLVDMNNGKKGGLQNSTRKNLAKYLQSIKHLLIDCDYIVVEQQFKTGQEMNFDAVLFGESCYSWLVVNLPDHTDNIRYTPSRYKTCVMGCPREIVIEQPNGLRTVRPIEKRDRKKWSVAMAEKIFKIRGQEKKSFKKGDDVSDCVLMIMAFILKEFIM